MKRINSVYVYRDLINKKILKVANTSYSIFEESVLEITKDVDHPDDYYFNEDEIIFTIKAKNNGDKVLRDICIGDTLDNNIYPIEDKFIVTTTHGNVYESSNLREIYIEQVTLNPNEEATITIKGVINNEEAKPIEFEEIEDSSFQEN